MSNRKKQKWENHLLQTGDAVPRFAVGHDYNSGTRNIRSFWYPIPDELENLRARRLLVVDTPGFDDMKISDQEILRRTSAWLAYAYAKGMKVAGVIFLHDISPPRLHPAALRNIEVLRGLCGDSALSSVFFMTTKWGLVTEQDGNKREQQLCDGLWKDMIDAGSSVGRFDGTHESARTIVRNILQMFDNIRPTDILQSYEEMIDRLRHIPEKDLDKALRQKLLHLHMDEILQEVKNTRNIGVLQIQVELVDVSHRISETLAGKALCLKPRGLEKLLLKEPKRAEPMA